MAPHGGVHERREAVAVRVTSAEEPRVSEQTSDNRRLVAETGVVQRRAAVTVRNVRLHTSNPYLE